MITTKIFRTLVDYNHALYRCVGTVGFSGSNSHFEICSATARAARAPTPANPAAWEPPLLPN